MSTAPDSPQPETENTTPAPATTEGAANPPGETKRGPIRVGRTSGGVAPPGGGGGGGGGQQRRDRGPRPPKPQRPRREGEEQTASEREDQDEAALDAAADRQRNAPRGKVEVPNRRAPLSADLEA